MPAVGRASPRRATLDAIALALTFLAVDGLIMLAVFTGLVDATQGVITVLALAAIVLLLYRDDVMDAIATGNEKLGLGVDDEPVRSVLDRLRTEGWTVEHEVLGPGGRWVASLVQSEKGAYLIETRNRAYRMEHLGRARHHSAWLHGEVGGWVTPVLCLLQRDDAAPPPRRRLDHGRRAPRGVAARSDRAGGCAGCRDAPPPSEG